MERSTRRRMSVLRSLGILAAGLILVPTILADPVSVTAQTKTSDVSIGTRYLFTFPAIQVEIPVRVHLPASREAKSAPPPTLYVLEIADDFVYASAVADFLARCGRIPGLVVVGVDVDKLSGPPQSMIDFLDKELIPFVEKTAGAGPRRIVFGHSGRSFAALFMLLNRPDLFDGYICPGLGLSWPVEKGRLDFTAMAEQRWAQTKSLPKSFLFSLGDEDRFYAGIEHFTAMLNAKAPKDFRWKYLHFPGEDHESTKLKTLYQGLEFVFGAGPASGK